MKSRVYGAGTIDGRHHSVQGITEGAAGIGMELL